MFVILAIDALEYELVHRYSCEHLMQQHHGKTDISEFSEPRTMVLWSSFMTGKNQESYILSFGDKEMWNVRFDIIDTFFSKFQNPCVIDLPGYSYDLIQHGKERELLKAFFETSEREKKEEIKKEYNSLAFSHHRIIKERFEEAMNGDYDLVIGYFSVADVVGHLNFSNDMMMRMIYREFDEMASAIPGPKLILSDHGMEALGVFGDHSTYGFWSSGSFDLRTPRITDFHHLIEKLKEGN